MDGDPSNVTVLQVLPSLVAGGVERGTIEINQAIVGAGWTGLVASAGEDAAIADLQQLPLLLQEQLRRSDRP